MLKGVFYIPLREAESMTKKTHTKGGLAGRTENEGRLHLLNDIRTSLAITADAAKLLIDLEKEKANPRKMELLKTMVENLDKINATLDAVKAVTGEGGVEGRVYFDIMNLIQQVCATHDILFLQRQLHYHISASADLPKVYANPEQILIVLSNLIANAIKYAPRNSDIEINVKEVNLRQGSGVEISIINTNEEFTEKNRYHILEKFYKDSTSGSSDGFSLAVCREIIQQSHGQLWVDIPSKGKVAFAFVLPCVEVKGGKPPNYHTFKYDITIANYEGITKKYGIEKGSLLLSQIEEYVRRLVRYPMDVVAAFEQSGTVSTIYETEEGNAPSVAARISEKLNSERFHIGKEPVEVTLQYRLSTLQ